jgi:hypothetical protein
MGCGFKPAGECLGVIEDRPRRVDAAHPLEPLEPG